MFAQESISSRAALVQSTEELVAALQLLSPPERAQELHQQAEDRLGRVLEWLSLELLASQTRDNVPLRAANDMIPELRARNFTLKRNLSNLKFIYNLPD
jgi:DNA replication protein DnaC